MVYQSDALVETIGLNVKPGDFGRSYDLLWDPVVIPELVSSGVRHVRVGIAATGDSPAHQATYFERLAQMGSLGVKLSVVTPGPSFNLSTLDSDWGKWRSIVGSD